MSSWNKDAYRLQVARVFASSASETVLNGTAEHARVVTEEAFKAAKTRVRILSNRLDRSCYADEGIRTAVEDFLAKPGTFLDILVETDMDAHAKEAFLVPAMKVAPDRVRIRRVPDATVAGYGFNFLTVDTKSYRFEQDREYPIAVVGGGATAAGIATHLAGLFDNLFQASVPIQ